MVCITNHIVWGSLIVMLGQIDPDPPVSAKNRPDAAPGHSDRVKWVKLSFIGLPAMIVCLRGFYFIRFVVGVACDCATAALMVKI